jgi:hypothetical protein
VADGCPRLATSSGPRDYGIRLQLRILTESLRHLTAYPADTARQCDLPARLLRNASLRSSGIERRQAVALSSRFAGRCGQLRKRSGEGVTLPRCTGITGAVEIAQQPGNRGIGYFGADGVDSRRRSAPEGRCPGEQVRSRGLWVIGLARRAKGGALFREIGSELTRAGRGGGMHGSRRCSLSAT